MEELEALKEAEETALKQAEIAAEEAARGLLGDIDLLDDVSLHTNDENHIETPSTRSLSRDEKSSPEDSKTDSAGSFQNPTQPLSAAIKPNVSEAGMTQSAIQRHVRNLHNIIFCTDEMLTRKVDLWSSFSRMHMYLYYTYIPMM